MCNETKRKRKRGGGRPKNRQPETTVLENNVNSASPPTTSAAENEAVFSVNNVELINPNAPSSSDRRGRARGRPRKVPALEPPVSATNAKTLVMPNANGAVSTALIKTESAAVRAVPEMDAVVKVFCVHTEPNFSLPWQRKRQYSSSSSGFVIKGRRVLTNAHSVEHYTQVKLKKRGSDTKYVATVLAIGTECDIALLTVEDDEFWEGVSPVEFGDLPALQDAVTIVAYPIGGDTISVTNTSLLHKQRLENAIKMTSLTKSFTSRYKVAVVMPNLDELLKDTPTYIFASVWHEWRKTKYYPIHYSELIRLASLYKYGGIYLDSDIVVLKPLSKLDNTVGYEYEHGAKTLNGAVMMFKKHSVFILSCLEEFYASYDDSQLRWNGADLITRVANQFLRNKAISDAKAELILQPNSVFFPIDPVKISRKIHLSFLSNKTSCKMDLL